MNLNWLKKLLGIDKIEDEITELRDLQVTAAEYATERMDKIELTVAELPNIEELFAVGICKLKKDEVYVLHVGENVSNQEVDALQRQMTKYAIKCVIVASDKMVVLNL